MLYLVTNEKGGVGKTTLAVNLAVLSALAGRDTLLVDTDPQQSATAWSAVRNEDRQAPAITSVYHYVDYVKQARMDRIDLTPRKDFLFSIDCKGEKIDDIQERLRAQIAERISVATEKAREALYYRMIGAGQFTSDGWLIGERIWFDGNEIKCECWPLPPAGGAVRPVE